MAFKNHCTKSLHIKNKHIAVYPKDTGLKAMTGKLCWSSRIAEILQ